MAAQAGNPLPVEENSFVAFHELPKTPARDLLLFVHEQLGKHNASNTWFSVCADYHEFTYNDDFLRRQEPCVVGVKASFSF